MSTVYLLIGITKKAGSISVTIGTPKIVMLCIVIHSKSTPVQPRIIFTLNIIAFNII